MLITFHHTYNFCLLSATKWIHIYFKKYWKLLWTDNNVVYTRYYNVCGFLFRLLCRMCHILHYCSIGDSFILSDMVQQTLLHVHFINSIVWCTTSYIIDCCVFDCILSDKELLTLLTVYFSFFGVECWTFDIFVRYDNKLLLNMVLQTLLFCS